MATFLSRNMFLVYHITLGDTMYHATPVDILSALRKKAADHLNQTNTPLNTVFFGEKEWQELVAFARKNWMVDIKPHQNNYLLGICIKYDPRFESGMYTVQEVAVAMAQRKSEGVDTDVGVVVTPSHSSSFNSSLSNPLTKKGE